MIRRLFIAVILASVCIPSPAADAPPPDAVNQGEELKAAAISKWEADIEAAMQRKAEAGKADNRLLVKQAFADLKHLKTQLIKAKAKTPGQYVADEDEKVRIAKADAERMAEEQKRKAKDRAAANEAAQNARGLPMPANVNPIEVVYAAQSAVKTQLKNPAGAKFPGIFSGVDLRTHCKYNGSDVYTVASWVDATNSFGGRIRVAYVAVMQKTGDGWIANDVVLIE